jgi:CRP/FNR family transcriptional regulator, anaerobic regulatory protein
MTLPTVEPDTVPPQCLACPVRSHTAYALIEEGDLSSINRWRSVRSVAARQVILREGAEPSEIFTLFRGWAFLFRLLPDGRRQIISFLLPGDLIGLQTLNGRPMPFSVQSLTEVTLCGLATGPMKDLLGASAAFRRHVRMLRAREFEALVERLSDLGRRSALERTARMILELHARLKARGMARQDKFQFPLRQEHIADALGLTPVHVSRTLRHLRSLGMIERARETLAIHDFQRLSEIACWAVEELDIA